MKKFTFNINFRARIGPERIENIFKACINVFNRDFKNREVKNILVDTTLPENNILLPSRS
jgi:hypothetical protein